MNNSIHLLERALCYDYAWTMKKYFGTEEYEKIVKMVKEMELKTL